MIISFCPWCREVESRNRWCEQAGSVEVTCNSCQAALGEAARVVVYAESYVRDRGKSATPIERGMIHEAKLALDLQATKGVIQGTPMEILIMRLEMIAEHEWLE